MDTFSVTGSHRKSAWYLASEQAAGGRGLPRKHARPPGRVQAKGVVRAQARRPQERRKKSAPVPDFCSRTRAKRFVCPRENCGYASGRSDVLTRHLRVHSGEKPFDCPREGCGYAAVTSGNLRVHLRAHSGEKPFLCSHEGCGYAATQSSTLAYHRRAVHSGEKPWVCPWENCGYASVTSGNLKQHLRVHKGERPFVCPWENCGYTCGRSGDLKVHKRHHSGEKPFVCPWENCRYASGRSGNLKVHLRRHSGKRPWVCSWEGCGRAFVQSNHLQKHWHIHTGEKPFVCSREGCGRLFRQASNLRVHLRAHSETNPLLCSYAGGGAASGRSGSLARQLGRCANAGSFVRLRKDSARRYRSSGARSGQSRTRAKSLSCFQNLEAGPRLPVKTQSPPSTVSTTAAARPGAQANLCPEVGRQRQRTGVSSDSPCAMVTASSGVHALFDQGQVFSDREERRSPGLSLSPALLSPAAPFEWVQSPSATGGMSDWLTWRTDHDLFEDWLPLTGAASDLEVGSSFPMDADKAFWQTLISAAYGEQ